MRANVVLLFVNVCMRLPATLVHAWAMSMCWRMAVVPVLGLPLVSPMQMLVLLWLVSFALPAPKIDGTKEPTLDDMVSAVVVAYVRAGFLLALALALEVSRG